MAATIRASTAATATTSPLSPASTQVGDLVIVFHWTPGTSGAPTHTIQTVNDFFEIRTHAHDDGSTDGRLSVAYKVATQAGANTYTAYTVSGGTASFAGIVVLTAGTYHPTLIGDIQGSSTLTTNGLPNPPSIVTPQAQCLVFAIGAWHMASATATITEPSGYLEAWEIAGAAAAELSVASKTVATATTEDPGAFGDTVTPAGSVSMTFAIRPMAYTLQAAAASFAFTGNAATLLASRKLVAEVSSIPFTGNSANLLRGFRLSTEVGSFAFTGNDVTLTHGEATGVTLVAEVGEFAFSGGDATITVHRRLQADVGSFSVTGNDANLVCARKLTADVSATPFIGSNASLLCARRISAGTGSFAFTAFTASLLATRRLDAGVGLFDLPASAASITAHRKLVTSSEAFPFSGNDASLRAGRRLVAGAKSFAFIGNDAILTSTAEPPEQETQLTGAALVIQFFS
jgi:hypothetical protein